MTTKDDFYRYVDEHGAQSAGEIANALGCHVNQVRTIARRAQIALAPGKPGRPRKDGASDD